MRHANTSMDATAANMDIQVKVNRSKTNILRLVTVMNMKQILLMKLFDTKKQHVKKQVYQLI